MQTSNSRRLFLVHSSAVFGCTMMPRVWAADDKAAFDAALAAIVGSREVSEAGITLTTPAIAENGNTVPITVEVDEPFSAERYVRAIHILAEQNPQPEVASYYFTPAAGRAKVAARIRLARTQRVFALAELSDERVLRAANEVKVTIGGCGG